MPDTNDKIKALYDAASQKFDIGTEQDFRQKLTDPSKRKAFYDAAVSEFDLGTYDEYEKKIGPTQKSIDEGKAMAAKVPSFKDFAAERGVYVPKVGEIIVASDISERLPSLTTKANIAKDVQEAPERIKVREERKAKAQADALKNNTIKALTANGTKFTEGDAAFKKMQESIKSVVDKGAMTLSADAAGNPIYKRSAGIVESIINNFETSRKDIVDSEIFRKSDLAESVKIAEGIIKGIGQEAVPSGVAAEIAGMVGSSLPLLGRAVIGGGVASKFLPGPAKALAALGSFAATISPSYDQAYKQGAVELYAKGLDDIKRQKRINGLSDEITQQEKEDAMDRAKKEASVSGFAEGIFTAGLSSIPLGAPVAGQAFKKALVNFAKNTAKEVPRNVSLGAASEVIKDVSARNAGYNITTAETLNNVLERSGQDIVTTLAFEVGFNMGGVANVPKYVKAAANNYLSTIPALEFNNFAKDLEGRGVVEQGFAEKAATEVNKYKDAKSRVASFIPEDDMPSFAGLIEKKTNLENQKKTTDPSFHAKIDEQIAAVDDRIKKMQESPNPIFDEVDELTGDTGDAPPVTQEEIEKSIEYADGFVTEVKSEQQVERLRAEEQQELASAIPNIEEYKTDGVVDRNKITDAEDLNKFDEIYNKYDKLITPLLEAPKQAPAAPEVPKEPSPFVPLEGFDGFEVTTKEGKKERYVNPDRVLSSATIRLKTRAEQESIMDAIGEPMDARQAAMIALMGTPNISYESFIKETGFGQNEIKTRRGRQTEVAASPFTRKEGNTVEGVAESVWENLSEEQQNNMDSQDIRNEIIDLLSTYKDQNEVRDAYIETYAPKEITDEEAMQYFSRFEEEIVPIEKEWEDWASERGEKEMALELDENYVDKLIEQYESTTKAVEPTARKEKGAGEEAGIADVTEEEGVIKRGDVKKYIDEQATREESTDFNDFAKREVQREGFDAEYKSARVEGETKEQYLVRKYCK